VGAAKNQTVRVRNDSGGGKTHRNFPREGEKGLVRGGSKPAAQSCGGRRSPGGRINLCRYLKRLLSKKGGSYRCLEGDLKRQRRLNSEASRELFESLSHNKGGKI